jgi:hypothetical protein
MTKWNGTQGPMALPKARFDSAPSGRPRLIIWPRLVPGKKGPLRARPKTYLLIFSPQGYFRFRFLDFLFFSSFLFFRAGRLLAIVLSFGLIAGPL